MALINIAEITFDQNGMSMVTTSDLIGFGS